MESTERKYVTGKAKITDEDCPDKAAHVDESMRRWDAAEKLAKEKGIRPEDAYRTLFPEPIFIPPKKTKRKKWLNKVWKSARHPSEKNHGK